LNILIIGGTRFLGKNVVEILCSKGKNVTLVSRRSPSSIDSIEFICDDRIQGINKLNGMQFDIVLDFICYNVEGIRHVFDNIVTSRYVLISSCWVPRLWCGNQANELSQSKIDDLRNHDLPHATQNYLIGKIHAELEVLALRNKGFDAVSLRLPIFLGNEDHTGRLDFYRSRFIDGNPVILVNGGSNLAQIAWVNDMAEAIVSWLELADIGSLPIWEALPDEGKTVRSILVKIANTVVSTQANLVDIKLSNLKDNFSEYLKNEPFWRELAFPITNSNILKFIGMQSTDITKWGLEKKMPSSKMNHLRYKELKFLENRKSI